MKNIIIGIIIGGIVFTLGGVVATTAISSTNVTYQNKTVNSALNELYNEATTGKELVAAAITNKGITTTSSDTYETMATNINNIALGSSTVSFQLNSYGSTGLNFDCLGFKKMTITTIKGGTQYRLYSSGSVVSYQNIQESNKPYEFNLEGIDRVDVFGGGGGGVYSTAKVVFE